MEIWIISIVAALVGAAVGAAVYRLIATGTLNLAAIREIVVQAIAIRDAIGEAVDPAAVQAVASWLYKRMPETQMLLSEDEFIALMLRLFGPAVGVRHVAATPEEIRQVAGM